MAQPESLLRAKPEEVLSAYKFLVAVLFREYVRLRREFSNDSTVPKTTSLAKEKERDDCKNYLSRHGVEIEKCLFSAKEASDTLRLLQHLSRSPERDFTSLISLIRLVLVKPHYVLFRRVVELLRKEDQDEVARYVDMSLSQVTQSVKIEVTIGNIFVQTVKLLFEEMNFTAADRFTVLLAEYINAGFSQIDELYNNGTSFIDRTERLEGSAAPSVFVSESQTEYVLGREIELIEANPLAAGDRPSAEDQVSRTLALKPATGNVAYMQFLDAVRRKNYEEAVDAIYRHGVLKGLPDSGRFLGLDLLPTGLQQGEASLYLCIMHYNAGHSSLALEALKECIFLAQERGDTHLLSTCMYWLTCLELNNNQYEKLYRGARGGEFSRFPDILRHFAATMARFDALTGTGLLKALTDLNCSESTGDSPPASVALIQQYSSRASLWKLYGFEDLAVVYAQASVQILTGCAANAYPIASDAVALSLGLLLEQAVRLNDETALEILLDYSNTTFPVDSSKDWHAWGLSELIWTYQRAFNQHNFSACEVLVDQLSLVNATEASLRKAELLYFKDLMPRKALCLLDGMYQTSQSISAHVTDLMTYSTALKLRILLLKSEILQKSSCGLEALESAKEALGLALDHPHGLLKAKVQLHLAYIWLHLKEMPQAKKCLALCFPVLSGCGYPLDQGRAWLLKATVLRAQTDTDRLHVVRCLELALQSFSRCLAVEKMLQCLFSIAAIYDELGTLVERDHAAGLFLELKDKFPNVYYAP